MKAVCLCVSLYDINEHAQLFMKRHCINYQLAVPQSIADCWQFYMCEYEDGSLPEFIRVNNNIDPLSRIGFGLNLDKATRITEWMIENGFKTESDAST